MTTTAVKHTTADPPIAEADETDTVGLDEAARVLGLPAGLLALRVARGDLPSSMSDSQMLIRRMDLATYRKLFDRQQQALKDLADDTEELMTTYGL